MTDIPGLRFVDAPAAPTTFNVLLYGPPKTGKTTAAATAPGPILWVNAEGGGALGFARKVAAERGTEIHEVRLNKDQPVAPMLQEVYLHVRDERAPRVGTVVVDTVGKLRDLLVGQIVVPGAKNSLQQFGQVAEKIGGFIQALRDLDVNLIVLAHVDIRDDAESGRIVQPLIGGKLTQAIPGEVDVVGYTAAMQDEDGRVKYVAQLLEGKGRIAGDRSGGLGTVRDLDLTEWLRAYSAALTAEVDADMPWSDPPADETDEPSLLDEDPS